MSYPKHPADRGTYRALTETSEGDIGAAIAKNTQIREGFEMRVVALILFALFVTPSPAWVQTRKPATLNEAHQSYLSRRDWASARLAGTVLISSVSS